VPLIAIFKELVITILVLAPIAKIPALTTKGIIDTDDVSPVPVATILTVDVIVTGFTAKLIDTLPLFLI
jgi:hypothetical protein